MQSIYMCKSDVCLCQNRNPNNAEKLFCLHQNIPCELGPSATGETVATVTVP